MFDWLSHEQFQIYLTNKHPLAYLIAYIVGILASLTPCVYPMIPVTVSFMGYIGETRRKIWPYATIYLLGMAMVYTLLGIFASLTGKIFGEVTTNPVVYFIVGIIFLFSSLAMLGVLSWDPFLNKIGALNKVRDPKGFIGAFLLGLTSGSVAAPCTAPILGALLSYVALTQDLLFGGSLLFAFSLGLGTLLWILSLFSGLTKYIPRGGGWGRIILIFFGILMMLLSIYFFYRAFYLI